MKYFLLYIKQTLRFVLKPMSFLPAIVMMCLIFNFSGQNGDESSALSYKVGVEVLTVTNDVLDKGWTPDHISELSEFYQFYIRKLAHFTENCIHSCPAQDPCDDDTCQDAAAVNDDISFLR